jgi:hypothetical protein
MHIVGFTIKKFYSAAMYKRRIYLKNLILDLCIFICFYLCINLVLQTFFLYKTTL